MLLRIHSDESLRSYVERNLFLNWKDPAVDGLSRLSKYALCSMEVKVIASILGWPGCYGFNRLLHHHTDYPLRSVFKDLRDISYSQWTYLNGEHWFGTNTKTCSFCPECVRDDLSTLGYSYWRRTYQSDVAVCSKHNVILITTCPFCDRPFSRDGHSLDVMWEKCSGSHLGEATPVINQDPKALKRVQFFDAIFSLEFHIPIDTAICVLYEKFLSLIFKNSVLIKKYEENLEWLRGRIDRIDRSHGINNSQFLNNDVPKIIETVLIAYDCFDEFVSEVKHYEADLLPIDSLWSTYRAAGSETAHYVEENYKYGVGFWSCPYPSPLSLDPFSNDGWRRDRPIIYPCCNFPHPRRKGHQLSPRMVDFPLPEIPVVDRSTLQALLQGSGPSPLL
ncbi:hypothetical protein HX859_09895 [Pseudomonas gingeri]|uniref:hypothetical protein n=1 Tax=Pseudomonas gingeri TaxID=117681 RepID=UPI0015A38900|nr:hypothetical protein [Pseudomonas gingeri]NVZ75196.1 hypothetical protein [Pseudomonas gingeri]